MTCHTFIPGGRCTTTDYLLNVEFMCEPGQTPPTPVVTTQSNFDVENLGNGVFSLELCSLPADVSVNANGVTTEVSMTENNQIVYLFCNGNVIFFLS